MVSRAVFYFLFIQAIKLPAKAVSCGSNTIELIPRLWFSSGTAILMHVQQR